MPHLELIRAGRAMLVFRLSSADWRSNRVGEAGIARLEKKIIVAARERFLSKAGFEGRIGHLLVVEDSALLAMDVELTAVDLGVERASVAPDAAKALALIETETFDAALVDLFLGNDDGRLVAKRLAELGIPFALMTGTGDLEWLQAEMPGTPVLTKPFTRNELAETLGKLC